MCGFSKVWYEQNVLNVKWISAIVKHGLPDQYIQKQLSELNDSSKGHANTQDFYEKCLL